MIRPVHALLLASLTASAAAQLPCWNLNQGTSLGLGDESVSAGLPLGFTFDYGGSQWTDIQVCDNGYVTLGATGGTANFTPSAAGLVGGSSARICPFWVDLDPTAGGDILFQAVAASGSDPAHAIITWVDLPEFFGTIPHTFQLVLIDGGGIRCSYDDNLAANTSPWLTGASPGGGVPQNAVSFAALPVVTAGNPTLHELDPVGGASPLAGSTIDWDVDGSGGYILTATIDCAKAELYGNSCGGQFTSFYEWFTTTPSIDLANSAIRMSLTGSNYLVASSAAPFLAPSAGAANLNLTDDSETTVSLASPLPFPGGTTTSLNVCSNGFISVGSNSAAGDFSPTPDEFLNWPQTTWAVWRDLIPGPTGAGDVWFEEMGGLSIITWDAVVGYDGTVAGVTPSTFQLQFDRASGQVDFVFQSLDTVSINGFGGGEGWIVGFTPGGPSIDPTSTDLSNVLATGTIATAAADLAPLTLERSAPPVVGATINVELAHLTPNTIFAGLIIGLLQFDPGIDLSSFGMPGCFQLNEQITAVLLFPGGSPTFSVPFQLPNGPNAPGIMITMQTAAFDPTAGLTPLGAVTSNGLSLLLGH